jgi:hypothetical protein
MRKRSNFLERLRRKQQASKPRDEELPPEASLTPEEILQLRGQELLASHQERPDSASSQKRPLIIKRGRHW